MQNSGVPTVVAVHRHPIQPLISSIEPFPPQIPLTPLGTFLSLKPNPNGANPSPHALLSLPANPHHHHSSFLPHHGNSRPSAPQPPPSTTSLLPAQAVASRPILHFGSPVPHLQLLELGGAPSLTCKHGSPAVLRPSPPNCLSPTALRPSPPNHESPPVLRPHLQPRPTACVVQGAGAADFFPAPRAARFNST
jgi:hypothetical protein